MKKQLAFYFDFSSPYGYLASERLPALANKHNLEISWHPIVLGFIFRMTKQSPLTEVPMLGSYSVHDIQRCAREHGIAYQHPENFPVATVAACRAFYWLNTHAPELTVSFAHDVYRAYFTQGTPISSKDDILRLTKHTVYSEAGLDASFDTNDIKQLTHQAVDSAVEQGVFGSPFMLVEREPFWGNDRIDQLDRWLSSGGW